jgi:hypothetical protein
MRLRYTTISTAAIASIALSMASAAPAATLFTTTAHTTPVAVGTTASATNTTPVVLISAGSPVLTCNTSTLGMVLDRNSAGTVVATVTSGTLTACSPLPATLLFTTAWQLEISGSPTTVGDVTSWPASLTGVHFLLGATYHGSFTTGVTAQQTGAGGHMCVNFNNAGQITGPLTANGRWDTRFCFEGTASAYSLT